MSTNVDKKTNEDPLYGISKEGTTKSIFKDMLKENRRIKLFKLQNKTKYHLASLCFILIALICLIISVFSVGIFKIAENNCTIYGGLYSTCAICPVEGNTKSEVICTKKLLYIQNGTFTRMLSGQNFSKLIKDFSIDAIMVLNGTLDHEKSIYFTFNLRSPADSSQGLKAQLLLQSKYMKQSLRFFGSIDSHQEPIAMEQIASSSTSTVSSTTATTRAQITTTRAQTTTTTAPTTTTTEPTTTTQNSTTTTSTSSSTASSESPTSAETTLTTVKRGDKIIVHFLEMIYTDVFSTLTTTLYAQYISITTSLLFLTTILFIVIRCLLSYFLHNKGKYVDFAIGSITLVLLYIPVIIISVYTVEDYIHYSNDGFRIFYSSCLYWATAGLLLIGLVLDLVQINVKQGIF